MVCYWLDHLIVISRGSEVMFTPCAFVGGCVCVCHDVFSRTIKLRRTQAHKQYFADTKLAMSSCASHISYTHDVIDDVAWSQSSSHFEILYLHKYLS